MLNSTNNSLRISVDGGMEAPAYLLRLREPVVFPFALTSIQIESDENIAALDGTMKKDRVIAVFNEIPSPGELENLQIKGVLPQFKDEMVQRSAVGTLVRVLWPRQLRTRSSKITAGCSNPQIS